MERKTVAQQLMEYKIKNGLTYPDIQRHIRKNLGGPLLLTQQFSAYARGVVVPKDPEILTWLARCMGVDADELIQQAKLERAMQRKFMDLQTSKTNFGNLVFRYRKIHSLSKTGFIDLLKEKGIKGIHFNSLYAWEIGNKLPTAKHLPLLEKLLFDGTHREFQALIKADRKLLAKTAYIPVSLDPSFAAKIPVKECIGKFGLILRSYMADNKISVEAFRKQCRKYDLSPSISSIREWIYGYSIPIDDSLRKLAKAMGMEYTKLENAAKLDRWYQLVRRACTEESTTEEATEVPYLGATIYETIQNFMELHHLTESEFVELVLLAGCPCTESTIHKWVKGFHIPRLEEYRDSLSKVMSIPESVMVLLYEASVSHRILSKMDEPVKKMDMENTGTVAEYTPEDCKTIFGRFLLEYLKENNLTIEDFVRICAEHHFHCHEKLVRAWITGDRIPADKVIIRLRCFFDFGKTQLLPMVHSDRENMKEDKHEGIHTSDY